MVFLHIQEVLLHQEVVHTLHLLLQVVVIHTILGLYIEVGLNLTDHCSQFHRPQEEVPALPVHHFVDNLVHMDCHYNPDLE